MIPTQSHLGSQVVMAGSYNAGGIQVITGNPDWDLALHSAIQVELAGSHLSHICLKVTPTGILPTTRYSIWEKWDVIWDLELVSLWKLFAVELQIEITNF